jgi:hypothetical protein
MVKNALVLIVRLAMSSVMVRSGVVMVNAGCVDRVLTLLVGPPVVLATCVSLLGSVAGSLRAIRFGSSSSKAAIVARPFNALSITGSNDHQSFFQKKHAWVNTNIFSWMGHFFIIDMECLP